ncbi:type II secretion system F family protein [Streptomyces lydicus]|uniref:type II secretion system F family protein n=1 Tax=Streptomyces lydicus TaxID=47763 RepID=UPI0037A3348E
MRTALAPAGDLLAACLAAGAGPGEAAEAVGRSLDGPVAERLRQVAAELRLGGEPAVVWRRLAALPGAEGLARCMERAGISGVPAVESASRIAADLRAEHARAATARARRAGVLVTLPLAACFLPAFLTLGVAPVLIGLAAGLLGRT